MAVSQVVLLCGANSWVISTSNEQKLKAFHNRALRHMTSRHIKKNQDGTWQYPDHESLQWKCGLFDIETYIKRRRGTLRKYLEEYRPELLEEAAKTKPASKNVNKILWWNQNYITKDEMTKKKFFWKNKSKTGGLGSIQ